MTPQTEHNPAAASGTTPDDPGLFGRITGIYFSPSETYPSVGRAPKVILPLVLMGLLAAISSYVMTHRIGYENMQRKQIQGMVDKGWIPAEQAEEAIRQATTGPAATRGKLLGPVMAAIVVVILIIILSALFKLYSMIMGAENTFKPLLGVTAWTFLALGILSTALTSIVVMLKDPDDIDMFNPLGSNLEVIVSMIASSTPKFIKALASWVDLFGIWRLALLSIGYSAVSRKLKVGTAAVFVVALYVIGALFFSAVASFFG